MYTIYDLEDGKVKFHPISKKKSWIIKDEHYDETTIWDYRWQWTLSIRDHNIYNELP